jgi:hypothetical protein
MSTTSESVTITSKAALAAALDVSRQALHGWMRAAWWPVETLPPWTTDDLLAIQDSRAAMSENKGSGDGATGDVNRRWKESQILRNRASTLRILRESARDLGQLIDASAVATVLRSALAGGACLLARQAVWNACSDAAAKWATSKGRPVDDFDRGELDLIMRTAVGNPVHAAILGALQHVADNGVDANVVRDLIEQTRELATAAGEPMIEPPPVGTDAVGALVEKLRLTRDSFRSELRRADARLAHAAIDANPSIATAVAQLVEELDTPI